MTSTSEKVRALYEKYPYPPREPGTSLDPYVDYILSFSGKRREHPPTFLDAGCGTGSCLLGAAMMQRDLKVYGCDFNSAGLAQIQDDVEGMDLCNVSLRQVDLLDFPQDFGPERGFDVIFCTGVIHHTPDPLGILKSLAGRLAPQGVLRLMVYAEKGRADLYRFSGAVKKLLGDSERSLDEKIMLSKSLIDELHEAGEKQGFQTPALRGPFENSHQTSLEEFADRYLHPHDVPYTLERLKEHIEMSGLKFLKWFEHRSWDLEQLLPNLDSGDLPQDPWARFEIAEELFDRDQYDLYLVGPGFQPNDAPLTWDCPLKLNPQVHFTDTSFRGFSYQYQVRLLFEPTEEITHEMGRICKAVAKKPQSLRQLLSEWSEEETDDWFHSALYLFYRDYLYRPV
jgi:SAM-dependent methyltransferase